MSSSTVGPKVKEFRLTPEIQAFGFTKAIATNGYLTLWHKSGGAIRCEFDGKRLPVFKKRLENAIAANENRVKLDENFDCRKFTVKFIGLLVQDAEDEYARYEASHKQDQNEKQKILDEINRDKTTLGISLEANKSIIFSIILSKKIFLLSGFHWSLPYR